MLLEGGVLPLLLVGLIRLLRGLLAAVRGAGGSSARLCVPGGGQWGAGLCLLRASSLPQPPVGGLGGPAAQLGLGALSPEGKGHGSPPPGHMQAAPVAFSCRARGAAPPAEGEVVASEQKLHARGCGGGEGRGAAPVCAGSDYTSQAAPCRAGTCAGSCRRSPHPRFASGLNRRCRRRRSRARGGR